MREVFLKRKKGKQKSRKMKTKKENTEKRRKYATLKIIYASRKC